MSKQVETKTEQSRNLFFGEKISKVGVTVNLSSGAGNKGGARAIYRALDREPAEDVPKRELMKLILDQAGEQPPMHETMFGQVTMRHHMFATLESITRHGYSNPGVLDVLRTFPFIGSVHGMKWTCAGSLDKGVMQYIEKRDPRGGVRAPTVPTTDVSPGSGSAAAQPLMAFVSTD